MQNHTRYDALQAARSQVRSQAGEFVRQTYALFAASLLAATVGAYVGIFYMAPLILGNMAIFFGLVIAEFVLLFGMRAVRASNALLFMLFGFTFISGLTLTPLLFSVLGLPGGAVIIAQAFALTTIAFVGLSFFAFVTKRDFSVFTKGLFVALLVVLGCMIINIFVQNTMFTLLVSGAAAILFGFFIIYDTQNIVRGAYERPVDAAVALYLDFLNLFVSLLRILAIFAGNRE